MILLNLLSQEWVLSTNHRFGLNLRFFGVFSIRRQKWCLWPYSSALSLHQMESYALLPHRFWMPLLGWGRSHRILPSVSSSSWLSWRLADTTIVDSGIPLLSVRTITLRSSLALFIRIKVYIFFRTTSIYPIFEVISLNSFGVKAVFPAWRSCTNVLK